MNALLTLEQENLDLDVLLVEDSVEDAELAVWRLSEGGFRCRYRVVTCEAELRSAASRYVTEIVRPRVFTEIGALLAALRKQGVELWAVSSTNKWVVSEGVRDLGIPETRVLAAEVAVKSGLITSDIVDVPTDDGKANALRRKGLSRPDVVFGNSIHDLAMLEIAAHPFPVNPSPALLEAAAKNGWGYFRPGTAEGAEATVGGE